MSKVLPPHFFPQASVFATPKAWLMNSQACYRGSTYDDQGYKTALFEPVANASLGFCLRRALEASRLLPLDLVSTYFGGAEWVRRNGLWETWAMEALGVKSRAKLFSRLKSCPVTRKEQTIELLPMVKKRGNSWVGPYDREAIVRIPTECADAELGQALRIAMDRAIA